MDLKAVGQRIKSAREAKNLTQEELAALVNLSPTHVSVIERGLKVTKLDTFVTIANALDCKLRSNGMPVPLLQNGYSIFNGTKYR